MSTIEITKILSQLQVKCVVKNLHYSLLVFDGKEVNVKIWKNYKNEVTPLFDKTIGLGDPDQFRGFLLNINEAVNVF